MEGGQKKGIREGVTEDPLRTFSGKRIERSSRAKAPLSTAYDPKKSTRPTKTEVQRKKET